MTERRSISIDAAGGLAVVAGWPVVVADAGPRGELRIGGPAGPVLRPLTFGQRWRVLRRLADSAAARGRLAAAISQAALVTPPTGPLTDEDRLIVETLALYLAGAALEAPGFIETLLIVTRATGWVGATLIEMEATEVDHLAQALAAAAPPAGAGESGWTTLRLVPDQLSAPASATPLTAVVALHEEYTDRLLRRAQALPPAREQAALSPSVTAAEAATIDQPLPTTDRVTAEPPLTPWAPGASLGAHGVSPSARPAGAARVLGTTLTPSLSASPTAGPRPGQPAYAWQVQTRPPVPSAAATPDAQSAVAPAPEASAAAVVTGGPAPTVAPPAAPGLSTPTAAATLGSPAGLVSPVVAPTHHTTPGTSAPGSAARGGARAPAAPASADLAPAVAPASLTSPARLDQPMPAVAPLAAPLAMAAPAAASPLSSDLSLEALMEVAEALATLLADESRLRGLPR